MRFQKSIAKTPTDTFYADRRNTDELDRRLRLREAGKDEVVATVHTADELKQFLKGTTKS